MFFCCKGANFDDFRDVCETTYQIASEPVSSYFKSTANAPSMGQINLQQHRETRPKTIAFEHVKLGDCLWVYPYAVDGPHTSVNAFFVLLTPKDASAA